MLISLAAGIPLGYVLGYTTAYTVLGEPVYIAGLSNSRVAAIAAIVLAGSFVTYLVWLRNRLSDEAAARSMAQKLGVEAELRMLRAQLEPHMLFNTLANLRGALAGSRADTTTLQAEFAQLAAYLEIMALRLGKRLRKRLRLQLELRPAGPMHRAGRLPDGSSPSTLTSVKRRSQLPPTIGTVRRASPHSKSRRSSYDQDESRRVRRTRSHRARRKARPRRWPAGRADARDHDDDLRHRRAHPQG
jgi:hypothetical protein